MRLVVSVFACLLLVASFSPRAGADDATEARVRKSMLSLVGFTFDPSTLPGSLGEAPHRDVSAYGSYTEWGVRDPYEFVAVVVRGAEVSDNDVVANIVLALIDAPLTCVTATNVSFPVQMQKPVLNDCSLSVIGKGNVYFSVVHFTYAWAGTWHRYSIYVRNGGGVPTSAVRRRLREIIQKMVFAVAPLARR